MFKKILITLFLTSIAHAAPPNTPVVNSFCNSDDEVHNVTIQTDTKGYFVIYNHSSQTHVENGSGIDLKTGVVLNLAQNSTRAFTGWSGVLKYEVVFVKTGTNAAIIVGNAIFPMSCAQ